MKTTLHSIKAAAAPWAMADVNTLEGWAVLPANTFSDGPASGPFAGGGSGGVSAVDYRSGAALPGFAPASPITLADPDRKLGFAIQADHTNYYKMPRTRWWTPASAAAGC